MTSPLANLTPTDWRTLAAIPVGAREIIKPILPEEQYARFDVAGIVYPCEVFITPFGQGVIAAARVLVEWWELCAAEVERLSTTDGIVMSPGAPESPQEHGDGFERTTCMISGEPFDVCQCFECDPWDDMPPGYGED